MLLKHYLEQGVSKAELSRRFGGRGDVESNENARRSSGLSVRLRAMAAGPKKGGPSVSRKDRLASAWMLGRRAPLMLL